MRTRHPRLLTTIALVTNLAGALLAGCGAGGGDDLYVNFERFELLGEDQRVPAGGGCIRVLERDGLFGGSSSVGGGSSDGDLMIEEGERGDSFVVVVSSAGEVLAQRTYNRAFLSSGKVDTFQITSHRGRHFEFTYRGGHVCVPATDPDSARDAG